MLGDLNPARRRGRGLIAATAALALLLVATGCGSDDDEPAGPGGGDGDSAASGDFPVTVETANGPVTIEEPPERVVALEWVYVEDLLALGITPVGIADVEGYNTWVETDTPLPDGVDDVGTRQEPSLERIAQLQPDLIVTDVQRSSTNYDALAERAPTLAFEALPLEGQWDAMEQIVRDLGRATGRSDAADTVLADLTTALDDSGQQIASAELSTNRFLLALAGTQNGQQGLRISTDNALAVEALTRIGLENAWDAPAAEYGFSEASVEALSQVEGDLQFLYVAQPDDDPVADTYPSNDLWSSLAFVESGNVHHVGATAWLYGGPLSIQTLLDRATEALTS